MCYYYFGKHFVLMKPKKTPSSRIWIIKDSDMAKKYHRALINFFRLTAPKKKPWNPLEKPIGVSVQPG